jgi:Lipopolysaccharide-assembly, LptC-related
MRSDLVAGVAGLIFLAGCAGRVSAPSSGPASSAPAATATATAVPVHVVGQGNALTPAVMTWSKANRKVYTIRALSFVGNAVGGTNGSAVLERPHITFIDRTGSATVADAPKATVKQRDNSIDMMGGVRARTAEGGILTCDNLRYDATTERLHGEGHVVLTGPNGLQLNGDHIDGDVRLHDVKVWSGGPG